MSGIGLAGIGPRTFEVRTTVVDPPHRSRRIWWHAGSIRQARRGVEFGHHMACGQADLYLCAIRDEHSKWVLGWSVADHMLTELLTDALTQDTGRAMARTAPMPGRVDRLGLPGYVGTTVRRIAVVDVQTGVLPARRCDEGGTRCSSW